MSKNLVDEYKKLAENDIPDLWNRIEAGISEKVTATSEKMDNLKTIKLEPISYQNRYHFFRRYGALIAACFCAAILIPVILVNRDLTKEFTANDTSAPAPAAVPATETSQMANELAAVADIAADDILIEEAPIAENEAKMMDAGSLYSMSEPDGYSESAELDDNVLSGSLAKNELFRIESNDEVIEIPKVTIEVIAFDNEGFGFSLTNIYIATIITDETDTLNKDISIYLRKADDLEFQIAVGETYVVDLSYWEAASHFTIMKVW